MDAFNWVELMYLFMWVYCDCHRYFLLFLLSIWFLSKGSVYLSMSDITSKCCNAMYIIIDWTSHMSYIMCNMFLMYLHTYFTYLHPTVAMGLNVKERLYVVIMLFIFTTKTKIMWERERRRGGGPHWKLHSFRKSINHSSFKSPWF
jgi:hypothetical protein